MPLIFTSIWSTLVPTFKATLVNNTFVATLFPLDVLVKLICVVLGNSSSKAKDTLTSKRSEGEGGIRAS
jgi:hypothetical protein